MMRITSELVQIREALEHTVPAALKEIGLEKFKKMSFFMSNRKEEFNEAVEL